MLHPNQFEVNEAWIAFWLNDEPIHTARDGSFNCICLMDAASCFILGNEMIPADKAEPSQLEAKRLLKAGWEHKKTMPNILFIPKGKFEVNVRAAAQSENIEVAPLKEDQLLVFIGEAKGFKEHVQGGSSEG